ncbi:hypothetical protein BD769DRAFT_1095612 [Suillus cothurnatus]|nr:hypothetical protein BD769DRAFT_1095612 [Suillus cothurnatus]
MTVVINDPSLWPIINWNIIYSYWTVTAGVVVAYDWILTLEQEIELIWRQRWSLMTVLYLAIRYIGIPHSVANALPNIPFVSLLDAVSNITDYIRNGTNFVVTVMLGVVMIARLHAMYQRSGIMLIFLVTIFLAVNITCGVITAIGLKHSVAEELILSGMYTCTFEYEGDVQLLVSTIWILNIVWEVLALCLSVWIAVKHFRGLRRLGSSIGSTIGDCFRVLIQSHVLYFASFVGVYCLQFGLLSPALVNSDSTGVQISVGALQILLSMQLFVLGPRLILSIREFNANLVADSDAEISMTSIVFQERVHVLTSSTV